MLTLEGQQVPLAVRPANPRMMGSAAAGQGQGLEVQLPHRIVYVRDAGGGTAQLVQAEVDGAPVSLQVLSAGLRQYRLQHCGAHRVVQVGGGLPLGPVMQPGGSLRKTMPLLMACTAGMARHMCGRTTRETVAGLVPHPRPLPPPRAAGGLAGVGAAAAVHAGAAGGGLCKGEWCAGMGAGCGGGAPFPWDGAALPAMHACHTLLTLCTPAALHSFAYSCAYANLYPPAVQVIRSPMPGTLVSIDVAPGQHVNQGDQARRGCPRQRASSALGDAPGARMLPAGWVDQSCA